MDEKDLVKIVEDVLEANHIPHKIVLGKKIVDAILSGPILEPAPVPEHAPPPPTNIALAPPVGPAPAGAAPAVQKPVPPSAAGGENVEPAPTAAEIAAYEEAMAQKVAAHEAAIATQKVAAAQNAEPAPAMQETPAPAVEPSAGIVEDEANPFG